MTADLHLVPKSDASPLDPCFHDMRWPDAAMMQAARLQAEAMVQQARWWRAWWRWWIGLWGWP